MNRYVRLGRVLAMVLTLIAAIIMVFNKYTHITNTIWISIKATNSSAFLYFVIANAMVFAYSALSICLSFSKNMGPVLELPLTIGDVVATITLFTGNAAAIAIEVVTWKGISQFGWGRFCNITTSFCGIAIAAIAISSLAALIYFLLLVLSMTIIYKKVQN